MAAHGADGGTGSARRRREQRFRSWLRHEQQSIAAVPQAAATEYYLMTDDEGGELSAGVRPALLDEGRPQVKLHQHAGIGHKIVQQTAEQLVEVPAPLSYSSFQGTVEQNADTPVPSGRGCRGGLLSARPDTNSAASSVRSGAADEAFPRFFELIPHFLKRAGLGPHSGSELAADSSPSTRRAYGVPMAVEEDESEPVTDEGKSTLGLTTAGIPGCSFSRCMALSGGTSRRSAPSGTRRGVGCGDRSGCFQLLALFTLGFWTLLLRARGSGKRLPRCFGVNPRLLLEEFQLSLGDYARVVCTWGVRLLHAALGRLGGALVMRQPTDALGRISCPGRSRGSHLESGALFPSSLCLAVIVPGVWVLLLSTENGILREMTLSVGAILGSTVDTCSATVRWWLWTYFTHFLRCGRLES